MLTILRYRGTESELISVDELLKTPPTDVHPSEMLWVDLYRPTPDEEDLIFKQWFPITDLQMSDIQRARASFVRNEQHFPKLEESEQHLFMILRGAIIPERKPNEQLPDYLPRIMGGQMNLFLNHRVIVTHRWEDMHIVERVQRHLESNPRFISRGPDYVVAQIMDATVDDALAIAQLIEERLEQLENIIMYDDNRAMASWLMRHRRRVHLLRRAIIYQQDIAARLATGGSDFVNEDEAVYYRDVVDHHVRASDHLDTLRVMVDGLMDLYFSMSSFRLNQVMRILTVISTVFLPITFITSWYGMNFQDMPELGWAYGYPAVIALIALVSIAMLYHARRRGWFG